LMTQIIKDLNVEEARIEEPAREEKMKVEKNKTNKVGASFYGVARGAFKKFVGFT